MSVPTPHNQAKKGDFAKTVLMPGDPLRAKYIAENYLENAVLVNNVRNIQGYTGTYRGVPVSVMASGMGIPSIGLYAYELFNYYDVQRIIRIGSAGALSEKVHVRDIAVAMGACTDSNFGSHYHLPGTFAPIASYRPLRTCVDILEERGLPHHVGNFFSTDVFYTETAGVPKEQWPEYAFSDMGALVVEMEAAGLYMTAAKAHKEALAICTVSDHLITHESTTSEERQLGFTAMMETALETVRRLDGQEGTV